MTKQEIINQLLILPKAIHEAELQVIEQYNKVQNCKDILTFNEDELLISGAIDGKNAETRSAQLRSFTQDKRVAVNEAENNLSVIKAKLNSLINAQSNLKTIAKLLGEVE